MPRKSSNSRPPPAMTRSQAMPVIIVAALFDVVRAFFALFLFFGPALAGLYCTAKASAAISTITGGVFATKTAAAVCSAAVIAGGTAISAITTPLGLLMADVVGFAGFLVLGLWIFITNARIFKNGSLWFVSAFGVSVIPFIGSLPVFSLVLWRLYGAQIQTEAAALKKYEASQRAEQLQLRNRQIAESMQVRALQLQDAEQAQEAEEDAESEEEYIPRNVPEPA